MNDSALLRRLNRASRLAGMATLMTLLSLSVGCDDDNPSSTSEDFGIRFLSPEAAEEGATALDCNQDKDPSTGDVLELDIRIAAERSGVEGLGAFTAALAIADSTDEPVTVDLDIAGAGTFADFALPTGPSTLQVQLFDEGGEQVAVAELNVDVTLDDSCEEEPEPATIDILSPANNAEFTAADDADGDLGNGLQTTVTVEVGGDLDGDVSLTINGAAGPAPQSPGDGTVTFDVTLPVAPGDITLEASVTGEDGDEATASVTVSVRVEDCTLSLAPQPGGGACDIGGADDADPNTDGVQVELVATTSCSSVTFTVNGNDEDEIDAVGGSARVTVTLQEGANTISATGSGPGEASADEYTLNVRTQAPGASLDLEAGENNFGLAESTGAGPAWTITGAIEGLEAGDEVRLDYEPALPGGPEVTEVGAGGDISFDVVVPGFWCGTIQVSATDVCGDTATSESYSACFDAVQPTINITAPEDGTTITLAHDADAEAAGVQVEVSVEALDARPDSVDYEIQIECGPDAENLVAIEGATIQRSDLVDGAGQITLSFDLAEQGPITCRATTAEAPNPVTANPVSWNRAFGQPTFSISGPEAEACLSGEVSVFGAGEELEGATLTATVSSDGAEDIEAALNDEGEGQFSTTFGAEGGPDALADGSYTVSVAGQGAGGVEVDVMPESVAFVVDNTAPVITLPDFDLEVPLAEAQDADMNLANCIQYTVRVGVDDPNATRACWTLNGGAERCTGLADGGFNAELSLLEGENPFSVTSSDCAGNETTEVFTVLTAGCPPRIEIADPADGAEFVLADDADEATAEVFDLDVQVATGLDEGAEIEVVLGEDTAFGPVAVDAEGNATVRVSAALPEGREAPFVFTLFGRAADLSSTGAPISVSVLFVPPTLSLVPIEGCQNAAAADASADEGFQVNVTATSERLPEGAEATLTADCGGVLTEASGTVGADGGIAFDPITLADEATCTLSATASDRAGQAAEDSFDLEVDRLPPTIDFVNPGDGQTLGELDDEDLRDEAPGIQYTVRVDVCGAAGAQLSLSSEPEFVGTGDIDVPEGDCAQLTLPQQDMALGPLSFDASVTDVCGNSTQVVINAEVDPQASIVIAEPANGDDILVADDTDAEAEGCQFDLIAVTAGLPAGAEYVVCTDFDQGGANELCGAGFPAGTCVGGVQTNCDVSLDEGSHNLTVVADGGEVVRSEAVALSVDCTAPVISSITIPNDANADGCINGLERSNPLGENQNVVTFRVETEGVSDGANLSLRFGPEGEQLEAGEVQNNAVEFTRPIGDIVGIQFWALVSDDIGNRSAPFADGATTLTMTFDSVAPAPQLLNLAASQCLSAADDAAPADDLQYSVRGTTDANNVTVSATLGLDGLERQTTEVDTSEVSFDELLIDEGAHQLTFTVADSCGNVGSPTGFFVVEGLPDWANPLPLDFRVDTVAPTLALSGVAEAQVLGEDDDANNDPADGFQVDLGVTIGGLEEGQEIRILSGAQGVSTAPTPVLAPAAGDANARATLPPGAHALSASATDTCGNAAQAAVVNVQVDIDGCASRFTGFDSEPAIVSGDGGQTVDVAVAGVVDLFNPDCAGATAELILDAGAAIGQTVVGGDGAVDFGEVAIRRGQHQLTIRVTTGGGATESIAQTLRVDVETPAVTITSPAGAEPVSITGDSDPAAGQQTSVAIEVIENKRDTARTATIEIDGVQQGDAIDVPAGGLAVATFSGVTVPAGASTLRVCVTDAAQHTGCATLDIVADPATPGDVVVTVTVVDPRSTEVDLDFPAPGDDGAAGGPVAFYDVRRATSSIDDEADWGNATEVALIPYDPGTHAAPGANETLTFVGDFKLNELHHVAVRGVDDLGRMSALNSNEVDLRMGATPYTFAPTVGGVAWAAEPLVNPQSATAGLGDVDGDGFDDVLVFGTQFAGPTAAAIVFGTDDPANADSRVLAVPAGSDFGGGLYFAWSGDAVGDVNGDGAPDLALLGYNGAFSANVGLYFGEDCAPAEIIDCRDRIATPDSEILTTTSRAFVTGVGNFNELVGEDPVVDTGSIDDLVIGGASAGGGPTAHLVSGRDVWPALLDLTGGPDPANGILDIGVAGELGMGVYAANAGDRDDNGRTELLMTSGNGFDRVWRFAGGDNLGNLGVADATRLLEANLPDDPCANDISQDATGSYLAGGVDLNGDNNTGDVLIANRARKRVVALGSDDVALDCVGSGQDLYGQFLDHAGDINGDGAVDIIVGHGQANDARTFVYFNDGDGRFGDGAGVLRVDNAALSSPVDVKQGVAGVGDFNGDGRDDVATTTLSGGQLTLTVHY